MQIVVAKVNENRSTHLCNTIFSVNVALIYSTASFHTKTKSVNLFMETIETTHAA